MNYPEHYESSENTNKDLHVLDILNEMRLARLESDFIYSLMEHCQKYEGVRDLMEMWFDETDPSERDLLVADLQESIDDIADAPKHVDERPYLRFDDLNEIRSDVLKFKQLLRLEVDRQGGISELAKRTGIPQPSLSRFFTSPSMPRRTTLFKIAKALHLSESSIGFKWIK